MRTRLWAPGVWGLASMGGAAQTPTSHSQGVQVRHLPESSAEVAHTSERDTQAGVLQRAAAAILSCCVQSPLPAPGRVLHQWTGGPGAERGCSADTCSCRRCRRLEPASCSTWPSPVPSPDTRRIVPSTGRPPARLCVCQWARLPQPGSVCQWAQPPPAWLCVPVGLATLQPGTVLANGPSCPQPGSVCQWVCAIVCDVELPQARLF